MHDIMYAAKIVSCLKNKFRGEEANRHIVVSVTLSPFTHVTAKSLQAAFRTLIRREDFKDVVLDIKKSEVSIKCRKCGTITKISEPLFSCPVCREADFDICDDKEFLIQSIEAE